MERTTPPSAPVAGARIVRRHRNRQTISRSPSIAARRLGYLGALAASTAWAAVHAPHWAHTIPLHTTPLLGGHFLRLTECSLAVGMAGAIVQFNARGLPGATSPLEAPHDFGRREKIYHRGSEPLRETNRVRSVRVSRICPSGIESEARFVISLSAEDGDHVILGTGTGFQTADEALGIAHEIAEFLDVKAIPG